MSTPTRQRRSSVIRKAARHFTPGEVLYLYGCDTGDRLYGVLRGTFWVSEIKHQSDTGVTFCLRPVFLPTMYQHRQFTQYLVEFARGQILTRLSGPPVTYLIEEEP